MFSDRKIVCIAAITVALLWTTTVGAQDPASPYGAAPAGGTTATPQGGMQGSGADLQPGAAGSGSAAASAPATAGATPGADPSGSIGSAATGSAGAGTADATAGAGMDATASAPQPVKKGPSASWVAAQNRASAKLREEQLTKMKGSAESPPAPANPPAAQ